MGFSRLQCILLVTGGWGGETYVSYAAGASLPLCTSPLPLQPSQSRPPAPAAGPPPGRAQDLPSHAARGAREGQRCLLDIPLLIAVLQGKISTAWHPPPGPGGPAPQHSGPTAQPHRCELAFFCHRAFARTQPVLEHFSHFLRSVNFYSSLSSQTIIPSREKS